MDALQVHSAIYYNITEYPFGLLVDDVNEITTYLSNVSFIFIKRYANQTAYLVVRKVVSLIDCMEWKCLTYC